MMVLMEVRHTIIAPAAEDTVIELFYTMGWKYGLL